MVDAACLEKLSATSRPVVSFKILREGVYSDNIFRSIAVKIKTSLAAQQILNVNKLNSSGNIAKQYYACFAQLR